VRVSNGQSTQLALCPRVQRESNGGPMFNHAADAERLIRCFDPDASLVEGSSEHLVISPRWGRIRRSHTLLATSPSSLGAGPAWLTARQNLLTCRDRSIQLAIATYHYRVRVTARFPADALRDPGFDLHRHCHSLLDRCGHEKCAAIIRREAFWIRCLTPDPDGLVQFECGNTFLVAISPSAILAEARTLIGGER